MSDAWEEIQAIKSKRNSLRERLEKRKREREDILVGVATAKVPCQKPPQTQIINAVVTVTEDSEKLVLLEPDAEIEHRLLATLNDATLQIPISAHSLTLSIYRHYHDTYHRQICNLLAKFRTQNLIVTRDVIRDDDLNETSRATIEVTFIDVSKVNALLIRGINNDVVTIPTTTPVTCTNVASAHADDYDTKPDIMSLLSMPSTKEKETKKLGAEILDLLNKPTAKERLLIERFRSQGGGTQLMEFCAHGTRIDCARNNNSNNLQCRKLHFRKILQKHTDETLGDCSFLNTCFHMDTCKYVHYEVDRVVTAQAPSKADDSSVRNNSSSVLKEEIATILYPPQWVQCDLRYLDMTVFGKFAVIMADPPWDIHMELPYGTMSDDEMRQLGIPQLQDDGLIFLWVTGRAMELGRECLKLWGYERVDELIWVKTNQLQRIIRTGRTGHWLNHGKEHCLVGLKGQPKNLNRGLDCDVIVAEVRATSHKPDEIYGIIERLSPGTRKIELFGRPHNVQPNWITLGNQVEGVRLVDPVLIENFRKRYPNGNCMGPSSTATVPSNLPQCSNA